MDLRTYLEETSTTQDAFAKEIGVTQGMVANWVAGRKLTPERAADIERVTSGRVTRIELRPDIFGPLPPIAEVRQARKVA